ncbi:myocardin-related transcription factor A-like [Neolamprologus brichardi]|uniref:myocardin-related transcription factor A-like n=1 Tax=Neolamprologus brichardi TaxID=32507 RepID=UPI001643900F|nr:myocardin-related transcription factor A-like [Neolamprologus brichardi]
MLEHPPCVRIDPAPFRPQPIRCNMDKPDMRFELERQACQSLRQVLQLKLQQRRSREELVSQGIMPPLKTSAAFHEQRRSLERARTEDYLKRKIRSRPEKSELIRMHILEEPFLQVKQLKKACLAVDLNDKIAQRPGPMELIHKNILPVHSSIKQAFIETQFQRASGENSSFDEDTNDSLSPEQSTSVSEEGCSLGLGPLPTPKETQTGHGIPSPTQVPPTAPSLLPTSGSPISLKLTNETGASSLLRTGANKPQPKPNCDRSGLRHKKTKDKPKIKKLKYHQYIPPDQKGDKEPPPHLDSSYAKILQQQQLFLQLQILSQQQQRYHTILPAPTNRSQTAQQPSSSSKSMHTSSSPPRPAGAPLDFSKHLVHTCLSSVPLGGTKPVSLPPNLDEMKVAELKSELKLRNLPVSGTKNDLIERLRTYQELSRGSDTTSSPTAGCTTGPGAEGAGKSSKSAAIIITTEAGSSGSLNAAKPQQFMTCNGSLASSAVSFIPSPTAMSPEDTSFNSDLLGELMSSPLNQLSLQPSSVAQLSTNVKEEPRCSTPTPCQYSLKSASLQRRSSVSSGVPATTSTAPVLSVDKDRLLQEKDKQIEALTRMLWQKQRLVEVLKMQLENGDRGKAPEPISPLGVKEEPLDEPDVAFSMDFDRFPSQKSPISQEMDITKVIVKQEVIEEEEVKPEKTFQSPITHGLPQSSTQTQEEHLAQQHIIQKVLLQQQQHNIQNQTLENQHDLQKLCQQRKKKSQNQQKQLLLQSQQQHQQSKHVQQMQLKQQLLLKQQKSHMLPQQMKTKQQTKQLQQIQIQTKIQLKQQQVPKQQMKQQQQPSKVPQAYLKQQSGSSASFSLDSTPTLVTDTNGNHFLIALTNHLTGNKIKDPAEGKATNHITLQRLQSTPAKHPGHNPVKLTRADSKAQQSMQVKFVKKHTKNGLLQVSVEKPHQGTAQCLSAPPSLQPFFRDQEPAPSGKTTPSSPSQGEVCLNLDDLFSPVSPASVQTAASSPDDKDTDHEDDFIDIILQRGETSCKPPPDLSLNRLNRDSSACSLPPSPLQVLLPLSPPFPPSCGTPHPDPSLQPELQTVADTTGQKQHLSHAESGRLEDFLESTTGRPLLGVEPGGLLSLIDDLHNQMLCTSSILNHPLSPMDTSDTASWEQGLDSMDWLNLTTERDREEESPSLALQTPPSVFSTDFLDSSDLHIHSEFSL